MGMPCSKANGRSFVRPPRLVVKLPMGIALAVIHWGRSSHPALPITQMPMEHSRVAHCHCRRTSRRLEVQIGNASIQGSGSC